MWISDKIIILHIPKTGGRFTKDVCESSGVSGNKTQLNSHTTLSNLINGKKFTVEEIKNRYIAVFIRHPKTRLQSIWAYFKTLRPSWNESFNTFVEKALTPNHKDLMVTDCKKFIWDSPVPVNFIGRQENLVPDLIQCLENAGETFDRKIILGTPKHNSSLNWKDKAVYTPLQLERLLKLEKLVIDKYY